MLPEDVLERYIPPKELKQVKRVLLGKESEVIEIPKAVEDLGEKYNFEVKAFSMVKHAKKEHTRKPRIVRIGLIQHSIVKPTNASIDEQYFAIRDKVEKMIDAAGMMGVNVLGLQEAWSMCL